MCMAMKNLLMHSRNTTRKLWRTCVQPITERDAVKEKYILPKLPGPLDVMNTLTMKSVICNLARDLNLDWNGPKPEWWLPFVPFQSLWKTTDFELHINDILLYILLWPLSSSSFQTLSLYIATPHM